jgi:hypothetical protein
MEPITLIVIAVLVSIGAGFGAGWGLKPDASVKALQAQTEAIEALQVGQTAILAEASKPIVLDAELKATLAEVPVQCRVDLKGDPNSVQCQWATCLQFGQSSAQRPECRQIEQLMVDTLKADTLKVNTTGETP